MLIPGGVGAELAKLQLQSGWAETGAVGSSLRFTSIPAGLAGRLRRAALHASSRHDTLPVPDSEMAKPEVVMSIDPPPSQAPVPGKGATCKVTRGDLAPVPPQTVPVCSPRRSRPSFSAPIGRAAATRRASEADGRKRSARVAQLQFCLYPEMGVWVKPGRGPRRLDTTAEASR
jgi:hypothetical protein